MSHINRLIDEPDQGNEPGELNEQLDDLDDWIIPDGLNERINQVSKMNGLSSVNGSTG
jgi:hypothetical protein